MFYAYFWAYPSYNEIQQVWSYIDIEITMYLSERISGNIGNKKNLQGERYDAYVVCDSSKTLCRRR